MSALTANKHTPVDASAGVVGMTLPTGQSAGTEVGVEKTDNSANWVSITGNIRGVAGSIVTLRLARESVHFLADAAGSWWPVADHKTLSSLDGRFAPTSLLPTAGPALSAVPGVDSSQSGGLRWFTKEEHVARAVGWTIVTDSRYAGGAVGDGVTDDTAAVQAAATAASGGVLFFPPGKVYYLTGTISITQPTRVVGSIAGTGGNPLGCVLRIKAGVSPFTVASDRVTFEEIFCLGSTSQGAAAAAQTCAITYTSGNHGEIRRCRFTYFAIGVWFQNCQFWSVDKTFFTNCSAYHLYIQNTNTPDGGDQNIQGSWFQGGVATTATWASGGAVGSNSITFTAAPTVSIGSLITGTGVPANTSVTAVNGNTVTLSAPITGTAASGTYKFDNWAGMANVRQESGGGVRAVGNKFIGGQVGYQLAIGDGMSTSILTVTGNSFELHTGACIEFTTCTGGVGSTGGTTGVFSDATIVGNQFTGINASRGVLSIAPSGVGRISEVLFNNNNVRGSVSVTTLVKAAYVKGLTVQNNRLRDALTAVSVDGNSSDVVLSPNHITNVSGTVYQHNGQSGSSAYPTAMDIIKPFTVTSTSAFQQVTSVGFNAIGGCIVDIEVLGNLQGGAGGALLGRFQRMVSMAAAGATPTLTTLGTDTVTGVPFNYQFVTTAGAVGFQLQRAADGGTTLIGTVRMTVRGSQNTVA